MNGKRIPDEAYFIEQILDSSGKNRTSKELRDKEYSNTEEFGNTEEYEIPTFNKLCRGESVNQMHHLYYQCHLTTNRDPYFMLGILKSRVMLYLNYSFYKSSSQHKGWFLQILKQKGNCFHFNLS